MFESSRLAAKFSRGLAVLLLLICSAPTVCSQERRNGEVRLTLGVGSQEIDHLFRRGFSASTSIGGSVSRLVTLLVVVDYATVSSGVRTLALINAFRHRITFHSEYVTSSLSLGLAVQVRFRYDSAATFDPWFHFSLGGHDSWITRGYVEGYYLPGDEVRAVALPGFVAFGLGMDIRLHRGSAIIAEAKYLVGGGDPSLTIFTARLGASLDF